MEYELKRIGDGKLLQAFDEFRNREILYKHSALGFCKAHFSEAEERARQEEIYYFCQMWSTDRLETQLEALSKEKSLEKDIMADVFFEMLREAKEAGKYAEFKEWCDWRRDMRSLHRGLSKVFKERLDEKHAKYAPKQKAKKAWFWSW